MKKCVVIGGGDLTATDRLLKKISDTDYIICCDSGYLHAQALGITPDLIVGDFDSMQKPETDIETILLPCEKDDTDSFFAVKTALSRGFDCFLLLGMTGGRFDHTLAAVSILEYLEKHSAVGEICDGMLTIRLTDTSIDINPDCRYFSVFAQSRAEGVTITGAKYNLDDAVIESSYQYGVSNEPCGTPRVSVKQGKLLITEIYE